MAAKTVASDFMAFARALTIPAAHGAAKFGDVMAGFQAERFEGIAAALHAVAAGEQPGIGRHWWEATKGSAKDSDLAIVVAWLLIAAERKLTIQIGARDQGQADEMRKALADLVRLNEWVASRIDVQATAVIGKRTGSRADILAADAPGAHGSRPDVLILNELTHLPGQQGQEFAATLLDNSTKMPRGLVVIACNAGARGSWQWDWRCNALASARWRVHIFAEPAPWLDPGEIAEAERRNSASRFLRLWRGVWSSGDGDAIDDVWIERAMTAGGPLRAPEPHWRYAAGLDLGLRHDFSALVVVGRHCGGAERLGEAEPKPVSRIMSILQDLDLLEDAEGPLLPVAPSRYRQIEATGALRLALVRVWKPRGREIDLGEVEKEIIDVHRRFGLSELRADRWQAAGLIQRLRKAGLKAEGIDFTGGVLTELASVVLEALRESRVALFDSPELLSDLRSMRLIEKSYGTRLESPRSRGGGHGDVGTSFALALWGAKKLRQAGPVRINRPMVLDGS